MNYLHSAMRDPAINSLALFDTHYDANRAFRSYLNEAMRLHGVVARHTDMTYRFVEGGQLRFGILGDGMEIMRYIGGEWQNVYADQMTDKNLAHAAIAHLFKPVYNGCKRVL